MSQNLGLVVPCRFSRFKNFKQCVLPMFFVGPVSMSPKREGGRGIGLLLRTTTSASRPIISLCEERKKAS